MSEKRGKFIVFEGIDASGKTTQAGMLYDRLDSIGIDCILTREPGSIHLTYNQILRKLIKDFQADSFFLFLADRFCHLKNVVIPALEQGEIVICDRYYYSTLVYQYNFYAKYILNKEGNPPFEILYHFYNDLRKFSLDTYPDITVYIDITERKFTQRKKNENSDDILDLMNVEQVMNYRNAYENIFQWIIEEQLESTNQFINIQDYSDHENADDIFNRIWNEIRTHIDGD